jgi:CHAD domain-containing protein
VAIRASLSDQYRAATVGHYALGVASRAYRLKQQESAADGARRIGAGRASKALEQLAGAGPEDLPAAIHGARKDLKKLRSLLRLIRAGMPAKEYRLESRRYREAGQLLSGSRDATVKAETLAALRERCHLPAAASEQWAKLLDVEREELNAAEVAARVGAAREAIAAGAVGVDGWRLRANGWDLVGPGLTHGYGRGRKAMKRALADPSTENVHEWRKRSKDLWYQLRILSDAWPELLGASAGQAHALADLLGDHHDLAVLATDLGARPDSIEREPFQQAIAQGQGELLATASELGRRLYAEKPQAFERRLRRYWRIWRED